VAAEPVSDDLSQLVSAATKVSHAGKLGHYLRWNYVNLVNELWPTDYTEDELMALNAIHAQALSRKLSLLRAGDVLRDPRIVTAQMRRGPVLKLIRPTTEDPATDFAQ
jgi:hypothetical protein